MDSSGAMGVGGMIIWIVILFAIMYFLMIRPQKKEQKRVNAMLSNMEVGDSIVTTSGFYGVIIDLTEEDVIVEFGNNRNCRIPMRKAAIAEVDKHFRIRIEDSKTVVNFNDLQRFLFIRRRKSFSGRKRTRKQLKILVK